MVKEIKLPEISENVESGDIINVLVSEGDFIEKDQSILEMETEKAVFEIPSPVKGKVIEISVKTGETIKVGQVILKVDTEDKKTATEEVKPKEEKKLEVEEMGPEKVEKQEKEITTEKPKPPKKHELREEPEIVREVAPAAPSVRHLARELGVDINKVSGSGPGGRISMDDVKNYAKKIVTKSKVSPVGVLAKPLPDFSKWGEVERKPMSNVRRITADNTGYAWSTIPHVTQYDKADITKLEKFRKNYGKKVERAGGKLTITSILVKVTASALKVFPQFNASLDMEKKEIVYKKYYNIGIAVDTDRGLLVPVIRDVDKKNIVEISVELTELSEKARNKKIGIKEMEGGNITISNLGGIGGTNFTPIVYPPQVAIIGVSRASREPVFINGQFEPCLILPLSLSYDHRIIDGADGARFLRWLVEALEQPFLLAFEG